eukprot:7376001-Prymnesium_polylepis.1
MARASTSQPGAACPSSIARGASLVEFLNHDATSCGDGGVQILGLARLGLPHAVGKLGRRRVCLHRQALVVRAALLEIVQQEERGGARHVALVLDRLLDLVRVVEVGLDLEGRIPLFAAQPQGARRDSRANPAPRVALIVLDDSVLLAA